MFERQLSELHAAGFTTPAYGPPPLCEGNPGRRIALTFDDGFANVFQHGLEPLARHGFRAIEFLTVGLIGGCNEWEIQEGEARQPLMDETQIKEWLAAGHEIGSHTLTHPFLTRLSLEQGEGRNLRQQEEARRPLWPAGPAFLLPVWRLESSGARPGHCGGI